MSLDPQYQQIVELFGLVVPELEDDPEDEVVGKTLLESSQLGDQSLREGDYGAAAKHYQRALQLGDADPTAAHLGLGLTLEMMEQSPQAIRQYVKAMKLHRENPDPYVGLSEVYKRQGRAKEGLSKLRQAISVDPTNPLLHLKLAEGLRDLGYKKQALRAIQHAIMLEPDKYFFHYWMGDLCLAMKEFEAALEAYRAAIELAPSDDHLFARASLAFWGAGKQPEAIKAIRLASDLNPEKLVYYGVLEQFLLHSGNLEEAELEGKRTRQLDAYDRDLVGRMMAEATAH